MDVLNRHLFFSVAGLDQTGKAQGRGDFEDEVVFASVKISLRRHQIPKKIRHGTGGEGRGGGRREAKMGFQHGKVARHKIHIDRRRGKKHGLVLGESEKAL